MFSNARRVLSQCNTRLRRLHLPYNIERMWRKTEKHALSSTLAAMRSSGDKEKQFQFGDEKKKCSSLLLAIVLQVQFLNSKCVNPFAILYGAIMNSN